MKPLIPFLLCTILLACRQPHPAAADTTRTPTRDSLVKNYLHDLDSLGYDDTASTSVRVLKAYLHNDTGFLKKIDSNRVRSLAIEKEMSIYDSCIHQPRLQDMKIEEGYRFIYSEAFCRDRLNITVTKGKDSINLHCILYHSEYRPDGSGGGGNIKKEYDKCLTKAQWDSLDSKLEQADFWGLSADDDKVTLDGDYMDVVGYHKHDWIMQDAPKLHIVHRSLVSRTPLGAPLNFVLQLSGLSRHCPFTRADPASKARTRP